MILTKWDTNIKLRIMDKNLLYIIVFFSVIVFSCNNEVKNDLQKWNLNGKVESIKETPYIAIEKFGEIVKGERGSFSIERNFIFNDKGYKIKTIFYNADGRLISRSEYKYDEKGNNIETFIYGSDNNLDEKMEYRYDEKRNLIEKNNLDNSQNLYSKTKYKNDEKGNLVKELLFNSDGSLHSSTEYKYDDKGNRIEWTDYNDKGIILIKKELKNDEKGNVIELFCSMTAIGMSYKVESKYEYDENNNWNRRIDIKDGKPEFVVERVIKYF